MSYKQYFSRLGLSEDATQSQIKSAYRKLALKFHPDHNPGDKEAEEKFKKILEAYEILNELGDQPRKKKATRKKKPRAKKAAKKKAKTQNRSEEPKREQTRTSSSSESHHYTTSANRKRNLRYNVFLSLEEVTTGVEKIIRYIRTKGAEKENVQLRIKIPSGVRHMQRLKVSELGEVSEDSKGDLFVVVHHQPHHLFSVENSYNIFTRVPVTYYEALTGAEIEIPTLEGVAKIKLRACEFSDISHEFPGKGLPVEKTGERGKLTVEAYVCHPISLNEKELNALRKMADSWPENEKVKQYRNQLLNLD